MARKVTVITSPRPGQGATLVVPQDVKDEIDELYAVIAKDSSQEGFAEFTGDNWATEMRQWVSQVRSYCASREAGVLKFRQLPSKHLPDGQIRFTVTADLPENAKRDAKPNTKK